MDKKNIKKNPFYEYFQILYKHRMNRKIKSKRFMIYFLSDFAWDETAIQNALKDVFDKDSEEFVTAKLRYENDIPAVFSKYTSGARKLSDDLCTACSSLPVIKTNVNSRIRNFLKQHISVPRQDIAIKEIQDLLYKIQLPNAKLGEFDELSHNKPEYFRDTFQIILTAEYKQDNPVTGNESMYASSSDKLRKAFNRAIIDCDILNFIKEMDSKFLNNSALSDKAAHFVNIVKFQIERQFLHNQNDFIYQKVIEFADMLYDLQSMNESPEQNNNISAFISTSNLCDDKPYDVDFEDKFNAYRDRLSDLYNLICNV